VIEAIPLVPSTRGRTVRRLCVALARVGARTGRPLVLGLRAGAMGPLAAMLLFPAGAGALGRTLSSGQPGAGGDAPSVAATLEQCVTEGGQSERSATFSGEMTAVPGAQRMAMRIDVQERMPGEAFFHDVSAPGLGVWRGSDQGVKIYKYLKQVTNLSSPAVYRGLVRFRWMNGRGHVVRRTERHTPRCDQPAPPPPPTTPGAPSSTTPPGSTAPPPSTG
jgi:hypothetical protein